MSEFVVNYHFLDIGKNFKYYDSRRPAFQEIYAEYLVSEPLIGGRLLDIGCGHGINPTLGKIIANCGPTDGVDPFPVIEQPAHLVNRWTCNLEDLPVEKNTYDMAYSYCVVEHVDNIDLFLKKTIDVIKPGSVFWSMSPNARHPFTWATRLVQILGLKKFYVDKIYSAANDYPAYYKLSSDRRILDSIKKMELDISQVDFYYHPNVHWDSYFPAKLKFIANYIDRLFLLKMPKSSFIFMFKLTKKSV